MQYLISKKNYKGEVVVIDSHASGYQVSPKEHLSYDGIKVNSIMIIKPDFIQKILKRKIKYHLDQYLKFIIDQIDGNDDESSSREALDDLARYRALVQDRYSYFLDTKYLNLLDKKFMLLEQELKENLAYDRETIHRR